MLVRSTFRPFTQQRRIRDIDSIYVNFIILHLTLTIHTFTTLYNYPSKTLKLFQLFVRNEEYYIPRSHP